MLRPTFAAPSLTMAASTPLLPPAPAAAPPSRMRVALGRWAPLLLIGGATVADCGPQARVLRSIDQVYADTLNQFDTDADGVLTEAELRRTDPSGSMQQLDADADGRVTASELRSWTELTHPRPPFLKSIADGGEHQQFPMGPPHGQAGQHPPPHPPPPGMQAPPPPPPSMPPPGPAAGPPIPGLPQQPPRPGTPQHPPTGGPGQGSPGVPQPGAPAATGPGAR